MDHPLNLFLTFPWCSSCGPMIRALLAHTRSTGALSGCMMPEPRVLSQDQLDAYVPVLVHRSQLGASLVPLMVAIVLRCLSWTAAVGGTLIDAVEHGNDVPSTSSSTASVPTLNHLAASPDMTPHRKPRGVKVAVCIPTLFARTRELFSHVRAPPSVRIVADRTRNVTRGVPVNDASRAASKTPVPTPRRSLRDVPALPEPPLAAIAPAPRLQQTLLASPRRLTAATYRYTKV